MALQSPALQRLWQLAGAGGSRTSPGPGRSESMLPAGYTPDPFRPAPGMGGGGRAGGPAGTVPRGAGGAATGPPAGAPASTTASLPSIFGGRYDVPLAHTLGPAPFQGDRTYETAKESGEIINPANPLSPTQAFVSPQVAQEAAGLVGGGVRATDYPSLGPGSNPPTFYDIQVGAAQDKLDPGYIAAQARRMNADTGEMQSDPIERILATQAAGLVQNGAFEEARPLIEQMLKMGVPEEAIQSWVFNRR